MRLKSEMPPILFIFFPVALNIQRGRDHGLKGYTFYKHKCGIGPKANYFENLADFMFDSDIEKLKKLYDHVDDIDLFVGKYYGRTLYTA